jgi:Fe-S-cluster-containing dehydrogenase component
VIKGTASQPKPVPRPKGIPQSPSDLPGPDSLEIVFRPDPTIWDGRFANSGWLQELPKPLTKLSWDSAALLSPAAAKRLGIENEDMLELRYSGRSVQLPAWIMPGQADQSITVFLGHGRRRAGRVGTGVGVDVFGIRTSGGWFGAGLELKKTGERRRVAAMHHHFSMEGRDLIKAGTLEQFRAQPEFAQKSEHQAHGGGSLIDEPSPQAHHEQGEGNAWGMVIDLNTCIGCAACVVACQAENNIPVVGREQVLASREMHWLRIDRYFEGEDTAEPNFDFQPVPCMHCEKAPCEVVCPTGATTHSAEGLNEMTYNRCVGTRYCSNNCPYKVRRFNFLHYVDDSSQTLKLMRNPDVTVRSRGVMEKCTYCVQRINIARIGALIENRAVGGDEVVTACQAACPARAITFGNLNDPQSAVARAKAGPRNYALLEELNTRPRTTYLAKLRNPNPEIEASARDESHRS